MLERAGIPTALLCTDEFGPLARAEAEVLGMPGLPLIAVPHPLAGNTADLVGQKADAVSAEILAVLTTDAAALEAQQAGRFLALTEKRLTAGAVCVDAACSIDPAVTDSPLPVSREA